jgi:regulatory protein
MKANRFSKDAHQKAMNAALRLLARRDHTKYEITQKLKARGFDGDVVPAIVAECERLNYIDDERSARLYIRQRRRRGFGINRIRVELKKKGLSSRCLQRVLDAASDSIDEHDVAEKALEKKMKAFEREKYPRKRKEKIYRFLQSRGFSESVVSESIRKFS